MERTHCSPPLPPPPPALPPLPLLVSSTGVPPVGVLGLQGQPAAVGWWRWEERSSSASAMGPGLPCPFALQPVPSLTTEGGERHVDLCILYSSGLGRTYESQALGLQQEQATWVQPLGTKWELEF